MANPAFKFHSPLDSLVRRTSARKAEPAEHPRSYAAQPEHPPPSPLLHGHFARNSTATASSSDNNSYLYSARISVDSRNVYQDPELEYRYYDDDSIYSNNTAPALRDSWQSTTSADTVRRGAYPLNPEGPSPARSRATSPQAPPSLSSLVPTVIVSSPTESQVLDRDSRPGRTPVVRPITSNFSRPVRPPISPEAEERKRRVLERNSRRTASPGGPHRESQGAQDQESRPPLVGGSVSLPTSTTRDRPTSPVTSIRSTHSRTRNPSPLREQVSQISPATQATSMTPDMSLKPSRGPTSTLNRPPSRSDSPASLYSTYSYYQLDSATPSPTGGSFHDAPLDPSAFTAQPRAAPTPPVSSSRTPTPQPRAPENRTPQTPQEYLQLGIQHHEANRLEEAAICFEKSAKEEGGCGVGMLMWGLTLRHGWGCEKNEKVGFKWLRRAAESAVEDLENARIGGAVDSAAVQTELVLAIYEVGQCFFQGWGVGKDQKMAVSYYTVAARLGDPDAQSDLAFCLANGKGCKKDRKEAAKWYRAAVAQGQSDIGLAWIYKEKFQ
ncbi:putative sel1-like repeats containing protein [Lyophyllum shimeji]|uniref:Sel1-like repeats containing protein n=1 Tax=Lyophyllum shimeji TaxID=47721 RepID=A0A9P3PI87_LYOSH|nr:putative sel1-like repeats containing protein [Lyophyllum shimeji]